MAAKFSVFLTLVLHVLLLLYSGRLCVISSTSDGQPLIKRAQEKLDDITLLMRKSGYGLTAIILEENLERFIHECGFMRSNVTIFAPRDAALFSATYYMPPFPVQILIRRLEEDDFWSDHMVKGTHLYPCEPMTIVNVTEHPNYNHRRRQSIGNARVLQNNIYKDDHIVVHGVDSFFDVTYGGSRENNSLLPWFIPWPIHPFPPGVTSDRVF